MKKLYRLYEFLFDRWKKEIVKEGIENWQKRTIFYELPIEGTERDFVRNFVDYKYTHKFDGSTKIVREYLN